MDRYTKVVLTIIAICLLAISFKMLEPKPVHSGIFSAGPTYGDLLDMRELKGDEKQKERMRIIRSIPMVRIYGNVDVDVQ